MATYTAFIGALRPGNPGSFDGVTYYYPVAAEMIMLSSTGVVQIPGDDSNPGMGTLSISSATAIAPGDDVSALRRKLVANVRPQYPQISATDTINVKWLTDTGLVTLNLGI